MAAMAMLKPAAKIVARSTNKVPSISLRSVHKKGAPTNKGHANAPRPSLATLLCARSGGGGAKAKKRTKYLSLSSIIVKAEAGTPPPEEHRAPPAPPPPPAAKKEDGAGHPQPEPFALHHELFAAVPAPSLSDILGASPSPSSASPDAAEEDLPRRALRGRERWVYCCSSPSATTASSSPCSSAARSLLLKLDYEDVLAAWADRGSLYTADPKPELHNVFVQVVEPPPQHAAAPCAWSTPGSSDRAERVRRYKQKRLSRLFAKRIRYEVRRANAVTRPRFKGRFIKEREGIEVEPT